MKSELFKRPLIHSRADAKTQITIERNENCFQDYEVKKVCELEFPIMLEKEELIVDFGDHYTGYLNIEIENRDEFHIADSPVNMVFEFAEMPIELMEKPEAHGKGVSLGWVQADYKTIPFLPYKGSLERRYSFRYLRIKRVDSVFFPVKIKALYIDSVSAVDINNAVPYKSSDPVLDKIDKMCVKTLKECEQDVFEDGPKRDRRLWIGDLRLQALTDYVTFKNIDLIKRCIYLFCENLNKDGMIPQCIFPDSPPYADQWGLWDYSLCIALCICDYYEFTGNIDLTEELFDIALRQVEYIEEHTDFEKGIINLYFFIDHQSFDKGIASLGYFIYVLEKMIVLAKSIGRETEKFEILIKKCKKALLDRFDEEKGLFVSSACQVSWHSQVWAVLSGALDKSESAKILKKAKECENIVNMSTPFMKHYYLEALIKCGMKDEALKEIKDYWGAILKSGFDCCPECFVIGDERFTPASNSNVVLNSACHAWSCTAAYWLRNYFK